MRSKGSILIEPASWYPDPVPPSKTSDDFDYNVPLGLHSIKTLEKYYPYAETVRDLQQVVAILEEKGSEFCFSMSFHPDWIEDVRSALLCLNSRYATQVFFLWQYQLPTHT
jgi:hypothetical protein